MTAATAPTVQYEDMRTRLVAAGRAVKDSHDGYHTELDRRHQLVLEALDQGMPVCAVATAIGLSHQRVTRLTLPRSDRQ